MLFAFWVAHSLQLASLRQRPSCFIQVPIGVTILIQRIVVEDQDTTVTLDSIIVAPNKGNERCERQQTLEKSTENYCTTSGPLGGLL